VFVDDAEGFRNGLREQWKREVVVAED